MAIETVNGYVCNNCTDVANAKKGVDPAKPQDGPNGNYKADKADKAEASQPADRGPAVTFGGQIQAPNAPQGANGVEAVRQAPYVPGSTVTLKA